ncbi:MAG TPA: hypothetical protein VM287_10325, partial [Egibacteraceae bacterium]|nr:hypothetical protein [Egibacteraceae bacterium]
MDYDEPTAQADNAHFLTRLAEELGELRAENARLSAELQAQKAEAQAQRAEAQTRLAALEGKAAVNGRSDAERSHMAVEGPDADVTRRGLLRRLGTATLAGAGVAVGTSLVASQPAAAGTDGDVVLGAHNDSGTSSTGLTSFAPGGTLNVSNRHQSSGDANAVYGAIEAPNNPSAALEGFTTGSGAGVRGRAGFG